MKKGIALLVHGSRDQAWMEPFENLAAKLRAARPEVEVRIACLQICEPDLTGAIVELAEAGAEEVIVVPVFISALGHVLKDVPKAVEDAKRSRPGLAVTVSPAIGELPVVQDSFFQGLVHLADEIKK